MIQNVIKNTFSAAGSVTAVVSHECLNGLLVSKNKTWHASDYLTVKLKSALHVPEILVNRVSMKTLASMSDLEYGFSAATADVLDAIDTSAAGSDYVWTGYVAVIPLGSLKMIANQSELEVVFESGEAATVSVATFFSADAVDVIFKWHETTVLSGTQMNVDSLYLVKGSDVTDPSGEDISVQIRGPHTSTLCNAMDLWAFSAGLGAIEALGPLRCVKAFENADDLYDKVQYNVTGTTAGYTILIKAVDQKVERVSRSNIDAVHRVIGILQGKSEAERRALKRAGTTPNLVDIAKAAMLMNNG